MEPTIEFWQSFYQYVPRYLKYIKLIRSVIKEDPELSKIDQLDREKLDKEIEADLEEIGIKHLQHLFQDSRNSSLLQMVPTSIHSPINPINLIRISIFTR